MNGRLLCLLAALPLAGCIAMPQYVPLEPGVQSSLKEVRVVSAISQDEIFLSAANPGVAQAAGGGLIAALIDSQIAKGRQDEIQKIIDPFYVAVDDVDFRKMYWDAVLPELQKIHAGRIAEIKTTAAVISYTERGKLLGALPAGKAFMYMATRYSFTPDFSRLNVITSIDLWRGGQPEPAYSNVFYYQSAPVTDKGASAIALWGKDAGSLYRSVLAESVAETAKMLRLDAEHPRIKGADQRLPGSSRTIEARKAGPEGPAVTGPALEELPARVVVRNTDGRLHSLPR